MHSPFRANANAHNQPPAELAHHGIKAIVLGQPYHSLSSSISLSPFSASFVIPNGFEALRPSHPCEGHTPVQSVCCTNGEWKAGNARTKQRAWTRNNDDCSTGKGVGDEGGSPHRQSSGSDTGKESGRSENNKKERNRRESMKGFASCSDDENGGGGGAFPTCSPKDSRNIPNPAKYPTFSTDRSQEGLGGREMTENTNWGQSRCGRAPCRALRRMACHAKKAVADGFVASRTFFVILVAKAPPGACYKPCGLTRIHTQLLE